MHDDENGSVVAVKKTHLGCNDLYVIDCKWISFGGPGGNRTHNLSIKSRMLCQLSYRSISGDRCPVAWRPPQQQFTSLKMGRAKHCPLEEFTTSGISLQPSARHTRPYPGLEHLAASARTFIHSSPLECRSPENHPEKMSGEKPVV